MTDFTKYIEWTGNQDNSEIEPEHLLNKRVFVSFKMNPERFTSNSYSSNELSWAIYNGKYDIARYVVEDTE